MRDEKGQFTKGSKPMNGFKKGVVPKTAFKKGHVPATKSYIVHSKLCKTCGNIYFKGVISVPRFKKTKYCSIVCKSNDNEVKEKFTKLVSKPFSPERKEKHRHFFKTGEESDKWIKDRTKVKKSEKKHLDTEYKQWMLSVKKRDSWKCKIENQDCAGRSEAHHILPWREYPELRYKINNGITLCHAHHPRKRAEEKRLESYFIELVSVSKV